MREKNRIDEKKCPVCGKNFIPAPYHIYKSKGRMVCSWHCLLESEGKKEPKELDYCMTEDTDKEIEPRKRYAVLAKRTEKDNWSKWTNADDLERALYHYNKCQSLGYMSTIIDLPITAYLNQGARDAFETLKSYIVEQKLQISNENLENIILLVLQELTEIKE